jgi:mannitol/fructose-specific phosphotransferase system IIA component (Ntr-type)
MESYEELCNGINSMLRCFNTKKVKSLLKYKEFCQLLITFINESDNVEQLLNEKEDKECVEIYRTEMEVLKAQACDTIAAH